MRVLDDRRCQTPNAARRRAFTLIELLIVVATIGLLMSILLPSLSAARQSARKTACLTRLRILGQGLTMYTNEHRDALVPGRLPQIPGDDCNWYASLYGRRKYRPTFLAMMSVSVGAPAFDDPMACRTGTDRFGEAGDRQNYAGRAYVCPETPEWTDERNGSYGYNYQFLGNSRLVDPAVPNSFKNWPSPLTRIRHPAATVAIADCMGTAATFAASDRQPYMNNGREAFRLGNEGFNLDPPRVDPVNGEMAGFPTERSAADPRHRGRAAALWVDGHATAESLAALGYVVNPDGSFAFGGDNSRWSGNRHDVTWTPAFQP